MSMAWIEKYLSQNEKQQIEKAIEVLETQTEAEIVPVIVRRSSAIGHVPLSLTMLLVILTLMLEYPWKDLLWYQPWIYLWPVIIVGYFIFSTYLARLKWIQKVFVPERDEVDQVHQRAHLEFYANKIYRTESGTGVLLFVSVMERKAVILADQTLAKKLPADIWDQPLQNFMQRLGQGLWGEAFVKAIEDCGTPLKTHFPITKPSAQELKNSLIVKD